MENNLFSDAMKLQRQFIQTADKLKEQKEPSIVVAGEPSPAPIAEKRMVYETENTLVIVLRVPWAEAKDIAIAYDLKQVEIKIETQAKKYQKMVILPCYVVPHAGRATFSHEILRIELPKYRNTKTLMRIEEGE